MPSTVIIKRKLKWIIAVTLWFLASVAVFGQPGTHPYAAEDITLLVNGGHHYSGHNFDVAHSTDYGMPDAWTTQGNGIQGNDKMVWLYYNTPTPGWYEIRTDNINMTSALTTGVQTALFTDPTQAFITGEPNWSGPAYFPGLWATGAYSVPQPGQSASVVIYLSQPIWIAVDGFGIAEGKFELRVRRSMDSNLSPIIYSTWPYAGPVTYNTFVQ